MTASLKIMKKMINKDDIFGNEESDESDQEDEKDKDELPENHDSNDVKTNALSLPPIKDAVKQTSEDSYQVNETRGPMNGSSKVHPIYETESDLIDKKNRKDVNIIVDENRDEGKVPLSIWCKFLSYGPGLIGIFFLLFISILVSFVNVSVNYIIALWTKRDKEDQRDPLYFNLFWGAVIVLIILQVIRSCTVYLSMLTSSKNIHRKMTWKLLRAPAIFCDANPIGRILTRFAKDTIVLDYFVCFILNTAIFTLFKVVGIYAIAIISVPWMIIPGILNLVSAYFMRNR